MTTPVIDLTKIPSIMATEPAGQCVSDKYAFIPTTKIVESLDHHGWVPVQAEAVNVRKESRQGFQKHLIRFRHNESTPIVDGCHPEIVMTNSHDGLAAFNFQLGLFRMVCSNGLVVSNGMMSKFRITHKGVVHGQVNRLVDHVMNEAPKMTSQIERYQEITFDMTQYRMFVAKALEIRWKKAFEPMMNNQYVTQDGSVQIDGTRLERYKREPEILASNMWQIYNNLQNRLVETGGNFIMKEKSHYNHKYKGPGKVRRIKSINENIRVNSLLWLLMQNTHRHLS